MNPTSEPHLIAVGIIRRPHGVHGEASVEVWTDAPAWLLTLERAYLVSPAGDESKVCSIESSRAHGQRILVKFSAVDSPDQVKELQNWTIEVPAEEARPLDSDEYYLHDLVGLSVRDAESGVVFGVTTLPQEGGGGTLLAVRREDGSEFDIPFVREFFGSVDLTEKILTVTLPAGLTDLAAAESVPTASVSNLTELPRADQPTVRIDVVSIFPSMFEAIREEGVIARGIRANLISLRTWDLRDFATDKHRSTDDEGYGGEAGMVMLAEPIFKCIEAISDVQVGSPWVIALSPQGRPFRHATASDLVRREWLILLCGRYEGFDERVMTLVDQEISIGDFVVSGGEIPAMLIIDALGRLVEGVVGSRNSVEADSFYNGLLDHPHFTRPADFRGMRVPEVLTSGHAERIRQWRKRESLRATLLKRPDLLDKADLDEEAKMILGDLSRRESDT